MTTVLVEGWRFIPHSYAMVNHAYLLELSQRAGVSLYHRDVPYLYSHWEPSPTLLPPDDHARLRAIPAPPEGLRPDALLRLGFPHRLQNDPAAGRTFVWGTTEFKQVDPSALGGRAPEEVLPGTEATIIACSAWARAGFINSGAPPEKVVVVPCGVDTAIFKPASPERRAELRRQLGWEDRFVVLNISAMTGNKGIPVLLKGLAAIADRAPHLRVVLKGTDVLYGSQANAMAALGALTDAEDGAIRPRISYIGATLPTSQVLSLYQAADAYVSPYHAEGFNLPVLEAAACGLPVVCTAGGPTDDFTAPEFALRIRSEEVAKPNGRRLLAPDPVHFIEQLSRLVDDDAWREGAKRAGPEWVGRGFTWRHSTEALLRVMFA